jgi:hypothetical protein
VFASVVVLLAKRGVLVSERAPVVAFPARPRQDSNLRPAA